MGTNSSRLFNTTKLDLERKHGLGISSSLCKTLEIEDSFEYRCGHLDFVIEDSLRSIFQRLVEGICE